MVGAHTIRRGALALAGGLALVVLVASVRPGPMTSFTAARGGLRASIWQSPALPPSATCGADGMPCEDGDACTLGDVCAGGRCVPGQPVICPEVGPCQIDGGCDAQTGACLVAPEPDGAACDDGRFCSQTDACHAGTCVGSNLVLCPALDACHLTGICDPAIDACTAPIKIDGAACDDGDACTLGDACSGGLCLGVSVTICEGSTEPCRGEGSCDPATGACDHPPLDDGSACDDGDACTTGDACTEGECAGSGIVCPGADDCHAAGICDGATGACGAPVPRADGAACEGGTCEEGVCVPPIVGPPTNVPSLDDESMMLDGRGCGCEVAGASPGRGGTAAIVLGLLAAVRRKRRVSPASSRRGRA